MTDQETLIILSKDDEEWYCHYQTCDKCKTDFMCSKANFCPHCGRKIVGTRQGGMTIYEQN